MPPYRFRRPSLDLQNTGHCLTYSTASQSRYYRSPDILANAHIETFRKRCFQPERPGFLPASFRQLPACERWFTKNRTSLGSPPRALNYEYLKQYAETRVPLELTQRDPQPDARDDFQRFIAPLNLFLEWTRSAAQTSAQCLYLAQCQLVDLPAPLREDLPTPTLVLHAGKGDIYNTNIWVGLPPTYTPLHRDPNPNLFVQLAGKKQIRLLAPSVGLGIFSRTRMALEQNAGRQAAVFRGDEMMRGPERALLEQAIWGPDPPHAVDHSREAEEFEAVLEAGDGIFIPKGWWHSVKGVGEGVTASVSFDLPSMKREFWILMRVIDRSTGGSGSLSVWFLQASLFWG
jgi:Cupin-like domain